MAGNSHGDRMLSVREVMEYLGYRSRTTVYRMMAQRGLPHEHTGTRPRFRRRDVDAWLRRQGRGVAGVGV
jgi:excisionase family DNA binding protein